MPPETPDDFSDLCAKRPAWICDRARRLPWLAALLRGELLPSAEAKRAHRKPSCAPDRRLRQSGFGLIDAMVAVVIFGFGMAALAALYVRMAPQPAQNTNVAQIQMAANSLISALTVNHALLPLNLGSVHSVSGMPSGLQSWFGQAAASVPGFAVNGVTSGPDAAGNACSQQSCGVTFTLSWTQMGVQRQQTFYAQIGIS